MKYQFPSPTLSLYMYLFAQTKNDLLRKTFMLLPSRVVTSTYILNSTVTHNAMQHLFSLSCNDWEIGDLCCMPIFIWQSVWVPRVMCSDVIMQIINVWLHSPHTWLLNTDYLMVTDILIKRADDLRIKTKYATVILTFKTCWFVHEGEDFYWWKIACPMEL